MLVPRHCEAISAFTRVFNILAIQNPAAPLDRVVAAKNSASDAAVRPQMQT
jgi:hypothetical protein